MHNKIAGDGEPIVLLHGFLASSHYFSILQKKLARTNKVIAIDLLGFGKSPKPRLVYTYEAQVQALHATIEHLKIDRPFTLIGHSMGALIAARYALIYPDEVRTVQFFNPPLFISPDQAIEAFRATGPHYRAMLHSPGRRIFWTGIKLLPRKPMWRKPINLTDSLRASYEARETSYRRVILATEFFDDLARLSPRALLVVGRRDRLIYQENLRTIQLQPGVSLQFVDTDHHTPVKAPVLTERLIRSHLLQ